MARLKKILIKIIAPPKSSGDYCRPFAVEKQHSTNISILSRSLRNLSNLKASAILIAACVCNALTANTSVSDFFNMPYADKVINFTTATAIPPVSKKHTSVVKQNLSAPEINFNANYYSENNARSLFLGAVPEAQKSSFLINSKAAADCNTSSENQNDELSTPNVRNKSSHLNKLAYCSNALSAAANSITSPSSDVDCKFLITPLKAICLD